MKHALDRARRALVPASVMLTVTHKCQLACAHCYQAAHESDDLSTQELVALFDELQLLGTLELTFSGGEALVRRDLLELLAEARRRAFAVTVFTNGGPVTLEVARALAALKVMSVEVSLHGTHAATHDGFVGRQGSFARAVRAVELLDEAGVPVLVKSSVVRCNAAEVLALRGLFATRPRVRFLADVLLHGRDDGASTLGQRATPGQIEAFFGQQVAEASPDELAELSQKLARAPAEASYEAQRPCGAGRTFAAVQPDGDVLSCTHLAARPLGNLRESTFSALWLASPEARALRALTVARFAACSGCEYRHVCSKCPALSLHEGGALDAHSQQVCDRTKAFWGAVKARLGGALPAPPPSPAGPPPATRRPLPVVEAAR